MPLIEIETPLLEDVHEALLDQADKLDRQVATADNKLARLPLADKLDRQDLDMQWIKQLRVRAAALRTLAQTLVRAKLDHERAQDEARLKALTDALAPAPSKERDRAHLP